MVFITPIYLIILLLIAFYDFKYLAVPVGLFILTFLLAMARMLILNYYNNIWHYSLINLTALALILTFSILILFVLKGKLMNPFNSFIGVGDLLFFPVLCLSFSPINFIAFMIGSFGLILLIKPILFKSKNAIPLAGGLSIIYSILLVMDIFLTIDLYDDSGMIKLFFQ